MEPALKLVTPEAIELRLRVTDPEVLAELVRRAEPAERDAFALAALRIGVLAMKQAAGAVDERALRDAGKELIAGVEASLREHRTKTMADMASELRAYFDRQTGAVPQMVDTLVKRGGTLDALLSRHLGQDASTLAQTLAAHVGASSPIFQVLSPEQKTGLLARLEDLIRRQLEEQRAKMAGDFDLNREDSALSRLIRSLKEGQGTLEKSFRETVGALASDWSLDNENSSVARFKRDLGATIEKLGVSQAAFQQSVMKELEGLRQRRAAEQLTTRKGATFEDALGGLLQAEAGKAREIFTPVGLSVGEIKNCKKGDFVLTMGPESAAPGESVVIEAKDDAAYGVKEALAEMDTARPNRRAQAGVFVLSRGVAPEGMPRFQRHGPDVLVVWDAEDPSTDIWVQAGLEVARALLVRHARRTGVEAAGFADLERAIAQLEKDAKGLQDIATSAQTTSGAAGKILDEAGKLQKKVAAQVAALRDSVAGMKGGPA